MKLMRKMMMTCAMALFTVLVAFAGAIINPFYDTGLTIDGYPLTGLENSGDGYKFVAKTGTLTLSKNRTYSIGGSSASSVVPVQIVVNSSCTIRFEANTGLYNTLGNDKRSLIKITKASAKVKIIPVHDCCFDSFYTDSLGITRSGDLLEVTAANVEVTFYQDGDWGGVYNSSLRPPNLNLRNDTTLVVNGGLELRLYSIDRCKKLELVAGRLQADFIHASEFVCRGGGAYADYVCDIGQLQMSGGSLTAKNLTCDGEIRGGTIDVSGTFTPQGLEMYAGTLSAETWDILAGDDEKFSLHGGVATLGKIIAHETKTDARISIRGGEFRATNMSDGTNCSLYIGGGKFTCSQELGLRELRLQGGLVKTKSLWITRSLFVNGGTLYTDKVAWGGGPFGDTRVDCQICDGSSVKWKSASGAVVDSSRGEVVTVTGLPAGQKVVVTRPDGGALLDNIYADDSGKIYLRIVSREEPYEFMVNGYSYTATVHGSDTTAVKGARKSYTVTYMAMMGGQLWDDTAGAWANEVSYSVFAGTEVVAKSAADLQMTRPGHQFDRWDVYWRGPSPHTAAAGESLGPISCDIRMKANWSPAPEAAQQASSGWVDVTFVYKDATGRHEQTVRQTVGGNYVLPSVNPSWPNYRFVGWFTGETGGRQIQSGTLVDGSVKTVYAQYFYCYNKYFANNDHFENAIDVGDASGMIADLPVVYSTLEAAGEPFLRSSVIDITSGTLWYRWTAPMTGIVTFTVDRHGTATDLGVGVYTGETLAGLSTVAEKMFTSSGVSISFNCEAGRQYYVCVGCYGSYVIADLLWSVISQEEASLTKWTMNRYVCAELEDLVDSVPALGGVKAVKAEGLPKGLKLVQDKAKTAWYLEGVATEPLDYKKAFATVRFQFKDKNLADDVQKLAFSVTADKHAEHKAPLGDFSMSAATMFGRTLDATCTVSGMPSGLKYDKTSQTFSGKLSKLGASTLVAKRSVQSAVPGLTTKHTENYFAELLAEPDGGYAADDMFTVYKGQAMKDFDITARYGWTANTKCKATGMPSGMKFTAGVFSGKVTAKVGYYPVSVTSADKQALASYLVRVADPDAPSVNVYFGAKEVALMAKIGSGDKKATQNGQYTFMRGETVDVSITASSGATVKGAGLPAGLKIVQNKNNLLKPWSIVGTPTKVGTFYSTVTATQNGVSTVASYIVEVVENKFAGEYRGVILSRPAADAAERAGTVVVSIAAGGAVKLTVSEDGKSTLTYSTKSFGYASSADYAYFDFELKPSAADKKLGYGVRKGRLTVTIPDQASEYLASYRPLQGTVKLEDDSDCGEIECYFVSSALRQQKDRECRFFTWTDGVSERPIATISCELVKGVKDGAMAYCANVSGKLYDGTAIKLAKHPYVRERYQWKDKTYGYVLSADNAALAPFAVKAKDGRVFVFHGFKYAVVDFMAQSYDYMGYVSFTDDDGNVRTFDASGLDYPNPDWDGVRPSVNEFFSFCYKDLSYYGGDWKPERFGMIFDFGSDGFEMFDLAAGESQDGAKIFDWEDGALLLTLPDKQKIAENGLHSFKFTSKDKTRTYQVDLVLVRQAVLSGGKTEYLPSSGLRGMVRKTYKEGKETKTLHGVVDFTTLDPVE